MRSVDRGTILAVASFLALPVALFSSKALAPLFGLTAVAIAAEGLLARRWTRSALGVVGAPAAWLGAFVLLGLLGSAWSLAPAASAVKAGGLAATFAGGLLMVVAARGLDAAQRNRWEVGFLAGGIAGFALLAVELAFGNPLTRLVWAWGGHPPDNDWLYETLISKGAVFGALLFWPWAAVCWRRFSPVPAGLSIAGAAVVILAGPAEVVVLSMGLAGLVLVAARLAPGRVATVLGAAMVVATLAAPLIPPLLPDPVTESRRLPGISNSALHRVLVWRNTAARIRERPWVGHGLDSTRHMYGPADRVTYDIASDDPQRGWRAFFEPIPLHPHNAVLQIWLETGFAGAALLAGLLALSYRMARRSAEPAVALATLTATLAVAAISYGIWQSWWLCALWFVATMVAGATAPRLTPTAG